MRNVRVGLHVVHRLHSEDEQHGALRTAAVGDQQLFSVDIAGLLSVYDLQENKVGAVRMVVLLTSIPGQRFQTLMTPWQSPVTRRL